jgi:hypothetical protein
MLKICNGSTLEHFLITDSTDGMPDYTDVISFSSRCPITDADQFKVKANLQSVNKLLTDNNIKGKIVNNTQIVVSNKPYKCPGCKESHRSNNLKIRDDKVLCYDEGCPGI